MPLKLAKVAGLYRRSSRSRAYARAHGLVGMEFDAFGRRMGWRMIRRGDRAGLQYVLNPVAMVRYWEFAFTWSCLSGRETRVMDVSSPRLFALRFAAEHRGASVAMINPDGHDRAETEGCVGALGLSNFDLRGDDAATLRATPNTYDAIWSISVIEHMSGDYDDRAAVRWMYDALRPGGRLVLTVPCARAFRDEYRKSDAYGLHNANERGEYFFQRWYDAAAIQERLLGPLGRPASVLRWYGETTPGHFDGYIRRWSEQGLECLVDDARAAAEHYREFERPEDMPGMGICGLAIDKPA